VGTFSPVDAALDALAAITVERVGYALPPLGNYIPVPEQFERTRLEFLSAISDMTQAPR